MEWQKPSPRVIEAFEALAPPPPVEQRKMFGMPAYFAGGNIFAGVFADTIMLRLPDAERAKLIKAGGAPFVPMGRAMREYVTPPPSYIEDPAKLRPWLKKPQAFAEALPPKRTKAKKPKTTGAAKPAAVTRSMARSQSSTRRVRFAQV